MRNALLVGIFLVIVSVSLVSAHADHNDFSDVISILENPVDCSQLTEGQLERLGDYFMEQMHPGEAHEQMDAMMGGEGSESLRQMHIQMGQRFYCSDTANQGMMGSLMMGPGMMYGYDSSGGFSVFIIILIALAAIMALIWNSRYKNKGRKRKGRTMRKKR